MDFRADFGKEVIVVNVGAPHGLVHVGHKAHIGVAEDGTRAGGIGKDTHFLRNLLTGAHDGFHHLPADAGYVAGSFQ